MNLTIGTNKHFRNRRFLISFSILVALVAMFSGCNHGSSLDADDSAGDAPAKRGKIDVTVTSPRIGKISQSQTLNATTVYMLNDDVRAPISGYLQKVSVTPGQVVEKGEVLFTMQSKEAAALNMIKDTTLHISSIINVKATEAGIVKTISRQAGDYVQDGDVLCNIANSASLVFTLEVPFEMHLYIKQGAEYTITLPDGESAKARVTSMIPEMDRSVQMERYILKSSSQLKLPEGLIATVKIPTNAQSNALIVPKSAVLCDETQVQFWVMKLTHDSIAIKVPIEKGAETPDSVQIKTPAFSEQDKILISGNYGLPDTALVKVINR
jgi:biotin carboxyl carrier protein